MTPYEIMLSESQERMLLVAEKGREDEVFRIFKKWGLDAVAIGRVMGENKMRVRQHGEIVAEIPNQALTDDAPLYHRQVGEWKPNVPHAVPQCAISFGSKSDLTREFRQLLASPNICDKRWVYEQYDSMVQTNTMQYPGGEAGVIRIKGTRRGLAMACDGNGRWCYLEPKLGAMHAVAEAARNVACTGARPVAATNCLNFGNPEKPPIMGQFSAVIDGMTEACSALETPITGGNVSFYNETLGEGIYPTPVIGMVGILDDVSHAVASHLSAAERAIVLLTPGQHSHQREEEIEFGSSEYALHVLGKMWGSPPYLDLAHEKALQQTLIELARAGVIDSAKDCSAGGIATALALKCFRNGIGARVDLISAGLALELVLFAEDASRALISCDAAAVGAIQQIAGRYGIHAQAIGASGGGEIEIRVDGQSVIRGTVEELRRPWAEALESALRSDVEARVVI